MGFLRILFYFHSLSQYSTPSSSSIIDYVVTFMVKNVEINNCSLITLNHMVREVTNNTRNGVIRPSMVAPTDNSYKPETSADKRENNEWIFVAMVIDRVWQSLFSHWNIIV